MAQRLPNERPGPKGAERRRFARIAVRGAVQGVVVPDTIVAVREMSLGGMSVESAEPLQVGSNVDILLTLGDGAAVEVGGTIVYTRAAEGATEPTFISGIKFSDPEASAPREQVGRILDTLK